MITLNDWSPLLANFNTTMRNGEKSVEMLLRIKSHSGLKKLALTCLGHAQDFGYIRSSWPVAAHNKYSFTSEFYEGFTE
jgi:hypothetical protein